MKTLEQVDILSAKDRELLKEIKRVVQQHLPTAIVLLYGSVARGIPHPESDFDILVLTEKPLSTKKEEIIWGDIYEIELMMNVVISTQFCDKQNWETPFNKVTPFHKEIEKYAIKL